MFLTLYDSRSTHHAGSVSTSTSPQSARSVRSLDEESVATLVHAFVTSRINYCNGAPKAMTDKSLQRVINYAARIVSNTRKFDHVLTHSSTRYSTLVGCTRTRHIQAMHDRLQVSARNGTDICRRCAGRARRRLVVIITTTNSIGSIPYRIIINLRN